ncbi:MAG TPA: sigma-70 family RNA polymerase sigma factor [Acidimicrobiia bacterium]|nr:sigma-70 family RNA polymerase sigma factor [Acidimicrobiia bacterium]
MLGADFDEIVAAARLGSRSALAALYADLQPNVLAYLRARSRADAEDIASDVWVSVAAGLQRFQGDESGFRGWVFTIARRRLVDARRRRVRRATDPAPREVFTAIASDVDPEGEVVTRLDYEAALSALATLPRDQEDVVLLRVVAGLSVEEVGQALGKRPGTVRVLQHRALRRLATVLGDHRAAHQLADEA